MNIPTKAILPPKEGSLTLLAKLPKERTLTAELSVVSILNELVRSPVSGLDDVLADVLGRLAETSGADWSCIMRLSGSSVTKTHQWQRNGLPDLPCAPHEMLSPWESSLCAGRHVLFPDLTALDPADPMRGLSSGFGVGSVLILPMRQNGALAGILALCARGPMEMTDDDIAILTAAAEVIETVLQRRESEAQHQETARRLEATLAALPDLLFEITADGRFAGFSTGPVDLMVARPEDLPGQHFSDFMPPETSAVIQRALDEALVTGRVSGIRYRLDLNDDAPHWFELAGALKPAERSGDEPSIIFLVRDVSTDAHLRNELARLARTATEAHDRLENAIRALPDGVVILDDENRVVVANGAYRAMFPGLAPFVTAGASLESILTRAAEIGLCDKADTPEAKARWVAECLAIYSLPQHSDEMQMPDGRWLRRIHTRTSDGGLIAVAIDITARRNQIAALDAANRDLTRALEDRDRAEGRLLSIIEGAEVGTWELDLPSETLRVGGHWAEMLGRDPASHGIERAADFRALVHPDDRSLLRDPRHGYCSVQDEIIEVELRLRHAQGHWVWVLSRSRVTQRAGDGTPVIIAGVHIDISDRKQLEEEIRASRAYLSEVMDTSIAALAVLDDQGRILYVNLEAERILGLSRKDMRNLRYNDPVWRLERVEGGPLPDAELPFRQAIARGSVRDIRFAVHWPDGTRRVLSANAVPLTLADGARQVVVSFSDITEALAATLRLEEARSRAEESSRAKSIFLANMSHEIRTPLNGVLGMAEVLDTVITAPEQKQMVATIRRSGETLLTVLNSILDMSKIEAGKMALENVPFLLSDILAQVEALHGVQAEEKGLEFEVLSSAGADRPRLGDPHRITQILNNLLSNAIKFTEGGSVTLKLSCRTGRPVTIEVTDTGVGMTEAQVARVFESFEQADGSMTRRFGGTGLGLSIVRQLVLLMNGTIDVTSQPAEGTRIRVSLPLAEADSAPVPLAEPDDAPDLAFLRDRHLLIADDNLTNRMVMSEMLAKTGVRVTMVENGQDAVSAWERAERDGAFDLLLLDITMPVLDGLSALSEIRRRETERGGDVVPAIAVTANAMPNQVADYIMGGFDTHLAKPFKRKDLIHALRTLMR